MLICGYLNTFPNTFWGDGIWYFKYQIKKREKEKKMDRRREVQHGGLAARPDGHGE